MARRRTPESSSGASVSHIKQHADAVVRGDMDAVVADFSETFAGSCVELRPSSPQPTAILRLAIP
jgi:hypothetical protein